MISKVIAKIIGRYDAAIMEATVRYRLREENLSRFGEIAYADAGRILKEVVAADKRITFEEARRGYNVLFNDIRLFRVAVNVFSDRAEVRVDKVVIVDYDGLSDEYLNAYTSDCTASEAIKSAILATFNNALREQLILQLERL